MFSCPLLKNAYMVLMGVSLSAWSLKETADLVVSYIAISPVHCLFQVIGYWSPSGWLEELRVMSHPFTKKMVIVRLESIIPA